MASGGAEAESTWEGLGCPGEGQIAEYWDSRAGVREGEATGKILGNSVTLHRKAGRRYTPRGAARPSPCWPRFLWESLPH